MSVEEKKKTKILVSINNINDILEYKKVGITTFLFALKDYSVGYENSFTIDEINQINEKKYVLINRLLNTEEIENLKLIIDNIKCDGIVFEDIGLINVLKNKKIDKILFMNHFNCNSLSINYWLDYVDSVIISNELTYEEYETISKNVKKDIILHVFGYNQVMYSKRKLISNFNDNFNLNKTFKNEIKDQNGDTKFKILEQNNETIVLSDKIFNGIRLLNLDNIKYYYINTSYISTDDVLKFINNEKVDNTDDGFLTHATYYKVKEGVK